MTGPYGARPRQQRINVTFSPRHQTGICTWAIWQAPC